MTPQPKAVTKAEPPVTAAAMVEGLTVELQKQLETVTSGLRKQVEGINADLQELSHPAASLLKARLSPALEK